MDGSSALQVASGMVGALIVDDDEARLPPAIKAMRERVIVMHEVYHSNTHWPFGTEDVICYFCIDNFAWPSGDRLNMAKQVVDPALKQCGKMPAFWPGTKHDLAQTTQPLDCEYMLLNGEYQPDITMRPGEWQRLRIVQSSANSAMRLGFPPECEVLLLAMDGLYMKSPRNISASDPMRRVQGFVFTAGSRADLAVMCPQAGSYPINTLTGGLEWSHTPFFKNITKDLYEPVVWPRLIATVQVKGEPVPMEQPKELPAMGGFPDLMNDTLVDARYTVVYNLTAYGTTDHSGGMPKDFDQFLNGGQFSINGKSYLGRPTRCMGLNSVQEWTIVNAVNDLSRWLHSFHIHVNPYQIVSQNKGLNRAHEGSETGQWLVEDLQPRDWRDTVQVPVGGNVTIRFMTKDFTGPFPFHCHVTAHQGVGMMQLVEVVEEPSQCSGKSGEETGIRA